MPRKTIPTTRFRGVSFHEAANTWQAHIKHDDGRQEPLGEFPRTQSGQIRAARTYDRAALKHHGVFAKLNFPLSDYLPQHLIPS